MPLRSKAPAPSPPAVCWLPPTRLPPPPPPATLPAAIPPAPTPPVPAATQLPAASRPTSRTLAWAPTAMRGPRTPAAPPPLRRPRLLRQLRLQRRQLPLPRALPSLGQQRGKLARVWTLARARRRRRQWSDGGSCRRSPHHLQCRWSHRRRCVARMSWGSRQRLRTRVTRTWARRGLGPRSPQLLPLRAQLWG